MGTPAIVTLTYELNCKMWTKQTICLVCLQGLLSAEQHMAAVVYPECFALKGGNDRPACVALQRTRFRRKPLYHPLMFFFSCINFSSMCMCLTPGDAPPCTESAPTSISTLLVVHVKLQCIERVCTDPRICGINTLTPTHGHW